MSRASRTVGFFLLPGGNTVASREPPALFSPPRHPVTQLSALPLCTVSFESVLARWENMEMSRRGFLRNFCTKRLPGGGWVVPTFPVPLFRSFRGALRDRLKSLGRIHINKHKFYKFPNYFVSPTTSTNNLTLVQRSVQCIFIFLYQRV